MVLFLIPAISAVVLLLAYFLATAAMHRRRVARRARLAGLPPDPAWEAILRRNLPIYSRIPGPLRPRLAGLIHIFLAEKRFCGCAGLEITDEVRVTIAAQACILLLGGAGDNFPRMESIIVYPSAYFAENSRRLEGLVRATSWRWGESWYRGPVVLAWDAASHRLSTLPRGANLVMHEFAHQLDSEDGATDGTPPLPDRSSYAQWALICHREFDALRDLTGRGQEDVLDSYGATHPAEFFAEATSAFFERPVALLKKHPDLYRQLRGYYRLDPSAWPAMGDCPTEN
jgi:Mlc titration factor MtfA (ptsG expression regulator)